ncbi:hypothetical protein ACFX1X_006168 [Malus domestica]
MLRAQSSNIGNIPINKYWSSPLLLFGPIFCPIFLSPVGLLLGPLWRYNCNTFQHIQTCPHRYCGPDQAAPFAATQSEQKPDPLWHPDTGANLHITSQSSLVARMESYAAPSPSNVYWVGNTTYITHIGTLPPSLDSFNLHLRIVFFLPDLCNFFCGSFQFFFWSS